MTTPLLIPGEILHAKQLWNPTRGISTVLDLSKKQNQKKKKGSEHAYYEMDCIQGIFNIQIIILGHLSNTWEILIHQTVPR